MWRFFVVAALVVSAQAQDQDNNYINYGIGGLTDTACSGVTNTAGWYIDREFNSVCFGRQVYCAGTDDLGSEPDSGWVWRTCPDNMFFIGDGDSTCYSSGDQTALDTCGVTLSCGNGAIGVYVTDDAIWSQTADPLQLGNVGCQTTYSSTNGYYYGEVDLTTSEWSECGFGRTIAVDDEGGDGYHIIYTFELKRADDRTNRVEETHEGVTVTREKCFMVTATCYYNSDGTVTSSFVPTSTNALVEYDTNELTFELKPVTCGTTTEISPVSVFVNEDVCFKGCITTTWHENIRASLRYCYASQSIDPLDVSGPIYPLGDRDSNVASTDSTFDWDCYFGSDPYEEYFSFTSFRFQPDEEYSQNDPDTYVQTMYVHCEINACEELDDTSTHCSTGCSFPWDISRKRRAAEGSSLADITRSHLTGKLYVLPAPETDVDFVGTRYNIFSDSLSLGMFAMGCVLGVVVIGLLIVLKRTQSQVKYGALPSHQKL